LLTPYTLHVVINKTQLEEVKDILGDRTENLIGQYLLETQMMLSEIDIARATACDESIGDVVHSLKSSSFQVGASQVMEQASLIENFLIENEHQLHAIHHQSRLDHMISVLRRCYAAYQDEIYRHI